MRFLKKTPLAGELIQADRADTAEARALELEAALDALTVAIQTCRTVVEVDPGMVRRHDGLVWPFAVRAPHVQDPRVQRAMDNARSLLGRAL